MNEILHRRLILVADQIPRVILRFGDPKEKPGMNLSYAHDVLAAADEQRHGFIKLRGIQADHEVRLMAEAGLVEATFDDGREGSFTSINCVTPAGRVFLRAFRDQKIPAEAALGSSTQVVLAGRWKASLDLGVIPFRAVA